MNKILLFSISILLVATSYGQGEKKWEVGGELGFNLSTVSGQYSEDDDSKHKWIGTPTIGVTGAYNFTPMIAVVAGLYMIKSGATYVYTYGENVNENIEFSQRERYTNLRIPIAARFMWGTTWQYYGIFGLYVSKILCGKYVDKEPANNYEQKGKIKFGDEPENYEGDDWYLSTDRFRRLTIGLQFGAGVRKMLGPGYVAFNAGFGLGLCDFYKWDGTNSAGEPYKKPDGYKKFSDRNISFVLAYIYLL